MASSIMRNLGFDEGWIDITGSRQQPDHWTIGYLEEGALLWSSLDAAYAEPEMVHKIVDLSTGDITLPEKEWKGAKNALILNGRGVYKVFHAMNSFGAWMKQTTAQLAPGTMFDITVPVQMHAHNGMGDPWGAEFGIVLNGGEPKWINYGKAGDRTWVEHSHSILVPSSGRVDVTFYMKGKWGKVDFFIDAIRVNGTLANNTHPEPTPVKPPVMPTPLDDSNTNTKVSKRFTKIAKAYMERGDHSMAIHFERLAGIFAGE